MKVKTKSLIVIAIIIFFIALVNVNVYAESDSFILDKNTVDVQLNGTGFLNYSGGERYSYMEK